MKIEFLTDEHPELLEPITLTRSAQDIRFGGTTLSELVARFQKEYSKKGTGTLFIHPRAIPSVEHLRDTLTLALKKKPFTLVNNKEVISTYSVSNSAAKSEMEKETAWPMITKLSEIISYNGVLLSDNISFLAKGMKKYTKARGVFIAKNVSVDSTTQFDTSKGAIILEEGVTVLPFSYLVGPLVIGAHTTISPHSYIKQSSIGPTCKVGGEITHAVMQSFSNKTHYGFLGHSYVGEWVNLGGGSATSNLKNTYGTIRMKGNDTGEQLLGSIISDWSKVSAGTIISAGKILGPGAIVYGTVTSDVPAFTNYANKDELIECPLDIAITIASRMRIRRDCTTSPAYADMMARVFEKTRTARVKHGVKKGKLVL